jgi:hypothetical protein
LRCFFRIASGCLFSPVRSDRRSFAILDAIDPTLVRLLVARPLDERGNVHRLDDGIFGAFSSHEPL